MTMIWAFSTRMSDVSSSTEITAPSLDVIRALDAADVSGSTEVTAPTVTNISLRAGTVESSTEVTAASVTNIGP